MAAMSALSQRQIVGLGVLGAIGVCWWDRWRRMPKRVVWVPGWPLLGNLITVLRCLRDKTFLDTVCEWFDQYGTTLAFHVPGKFCIGTVDPKNVEYVLKTNFQNYEKGLNFTDPFDELLGRGIFNVDGDLWHVQRKTSSRMFTKKQFETHIWRALAENTGKVLDILGKSAGSTLDMFNLMNRFTLDTIGQIGFSKNIGSLEDPSSPFLQSFDVAQQLALKRFWTNPYWKVLRFLNLGWERPLQKHLKALDEYSRSIVRELQQKAEHEEDHSFVGLFVKDSAAAKEVGANQEDFLRDMVLNFLIAGRDTTAQALSWTFFELGQHPAVIAKVRAEVREVCGDRPLTYDLVKQLKYVQAVLDEGLRLHPSVPADSKMAIHSDTLPDGTVVPAGCTVMYAPYPQCRRKELWGEDCLAFRPERWLEMPSKPSNYLYPVFNAGPRECLGRRLAEMEMVVLIASFFREFDFKLECSPKDVRYDAQLTLGMSGLPVTVQRVHSLPGPAVAAPAE